MTNAHRIRAYVIILGMAGPLLFGCKKKTYVYDPAPSGYFNTLLNIIKVNNVFSDFYSYVKKANYTNALAMAGPYTLLVPPTRGITLNPSILYSDSTTLTDAVRYHLIDRSISLKSLPLTRGYAVNTDFGPPVYFSKYLGYSLKSGVNGSVVDTLTTVNGGYVLQSDESASNGLLDEIEPTLLPLQYKTLFDAITSNLNATIFSAILQRIGDSDVGTALQGSGPYTVFLPSDAAFSNFSYKGYQIQNIGNVDTANVDTLRSIVKWHIIPGRLFLGNAILESNGYDTVLSANTPNSFSKFSPKTVKYNTLNSFQLAITPQFDSTYEPPFYCPSVMVGILNSVTQSSISVSSGRYNSGQVGSYYYGGNPFGTPIGNGVLFNIGSVLTPE